MWLDRLLAHPSFKATCSTEKLYLDSHERSTTSELSRMWSQCILRFYKVLNQERRELRGLIFDVFRVGEGNTASSYCMLLVIMIH
ncbi:hypothetical protein BJV78DRAFT_1194242 [Lactifluus subvellereus]|nr:hypothetical protein BJV78DRAFT_1194242 [Lactifluus subvellereus]